MDFDDDDKPKEVTKARKFAPGRAGKAKPKPKSEPVAQKPEPSQSQTESVSKSEHDVDAKFSSPKVEHEVYNGPVKMEIDSKVDKECEAKEAELIEEDQDQVLPLQEGNGEEEEEEEDVVVREIDVFFNPYIDANTKLYVLQYPLRPSWRPYEMDERCEEVRVKPSTSQVEIDLAMDVHSKNYDSRFGSTLKMNKQTLTTTWKQPPTLDYAIGILSGDKLHLNPVHAVAQLRPSMQYLSSTGKKKQAESTTEESAGTSKKQNKGVQASTDQKSVNEEENWVALKYHGLQSEYCSRYLNGMMANGNSSLDFNMSPDVYINELCRGGSSRNSASKGTTSKRVLLSLPLKERLQKLLCEGSQLLQYRALKHYAPDSSDEVFLEILQEDAWLVQGLWTPKTKLLKLDGPAVEASRDYVLSLFNKKTTIKYTEVEATGRLRDKVKNMLTVFSKERPLLHDWKFKEPTDFSFIKSYPKIVKKQDIFWTGKKADLEEHITKGGKSRAVNRNNAGQNPSVTVKPEVPTTLTDKGGSSRNTIPLVVGQKMPEELRRVLPKALKKVFQTHKVCSYETICQRLRDLAVFTSYNQKAYPGMAVNVALAVDAHQYELQQVISEVAVDIHGSFVSVSSPDHPEYDSLREVVIKLLLGSPPGTKLMKADVVAAGMNELKRQITNNEYNKVMNDLCETNSSGWVLQKAR